MCSLYILNLEIVFHKMIFSAFWEAMEKSKTVQETEQRKRKNKQKNPKSNQHKQFKPF